MSRSDDHPSPTTVGPEAVPAARVVWLTPLRLTVRREQAVRVIGFEDEVNMVRHQAVSDDACIGPPRADAKEIKIGAIVVRSEKNLLPAIAALGNVMRDSGNDDAREPGHLESLSLIKGTVYLIPETTVP